MRLIIAVCVVALSTPCVALAQNNDRPMHGGKGGSGILKETGGNRTPGENNANKAAGQQQGNKTGGQQGGSKPSPSANQQ